MKTIRVERTGNGLLKHRPVVEKPVLRVTSASDLTKLEYKEYLLTDHWKRIRQQAFELAGYKCVVCNSPDRLVGHHRTYERYGREIPGDVQCLCTRCHNLFHRRVSFGRQGNFGDRKIVSRKKSPKWKRKTKHRRQSDSLRETARENLNGAFDRWMEKD